MGEHHLHVFLNAWKSLAFNPLQKVSDLQRNVIRVVETRVLEKTGIKPLTLFKQKKVLVLGLDVSSASLNKCSWAY